MRITDTYRQVQGPNATPGAGATEERGPEARPAAPATDAPSVKLTISTKARELSSSQEKGVDVQKIERLKELVEKGELSIDPAAIAAKIVDEET
jgi:flagellar biosynthesis anti-sigma factor FlgM